jgi:hypothetical protein
MQYMPATLLVHAKEIRDDGSIIEIVIWELPEQVAPSTHRFKYRLFFGTAEGRRVGYDNERGKGDHRHIEGREETYVFSTVDQLLDDFRRDVEGWSGS